MIGAKTFDSGYKGINPTIVAAPKFDTYSNKSVSTQAKGGSVSPPNRPIKLDKFSSKSVSTQAKGGIVSQANRSVPMKDKFTVKTVSANVGVQAKRILKTNAPSPFGGDKFSAKVIVTKGRK